MLDGLRELRDEVAALTRGRGEAHGYDEARQLAELRAEIQWLRHELSTRATKGCCAPEPARSCGSGPSPPYPPYPPFPPFPPYPPFPPFPPYPPSSGCCAPAPCGCKKCGERVRVAAPPKAPAPVPEPSPPQPERPQPIASSSSSSSTLRPLTFMSRSSSSSIFSTNVK